MSGQKPKGQLQVWGTWGLLSTTIPHTMAILVPIHTCWLFADMTGWTVDSDPIPITCHWWYSCTHHLPLVVWPYLSDGQCAALWNGIIGQFLCRLICHFVNLLFRFLTVSNRPCLLNQCLCYQVPLQFLKSSC